MTTKILKSEDTPVAGCLTAHREVSLGDGCAIDTLRLFVSKSDEDSTDRQTVWELTGWCDLEGITSKKLSSNPEAKLPTVMHSLQQLLVNEGWR